LKKQIISTSEAPKAVGPYAQAVRAGDFIFGSGQIPLDPSSGQIVSGGIVAQTRRVMDNLTAVLAAAGASTDDVVRTTIYLIDLGDFSQVNEVYATYFPENPPARATVQVAGLPRGASIEIDFIAYLGA
jgi:2-iminobutanoate/2-iminopropanoate deaminase